MNDQPGNNANMPAWLSVARSPTATTEAAAVEAEPPAGNPTATAAAIPATTSTNPARAVAAHMAAAVPTSAAAGTRGRT